MSVLLLPHSRVSIKWPCFLLSYFLSNSMVFFPHVHQPRCRHHHRNVTHVPQAHLGNSWCLCTFSFTSDLFYSHTLFVNQLFQSIMFSRRSSYHTNDSFSSKYRAGKATSKTKRSFREANLAASIRQSESAASSQVSPTGIPKSVISHMQCLMQPADAF